MYSIAQRHWLSRQRAESCPLKADVHKALTSLGIDAETGWRTDDGLVPVDIIVFISNRRQVALQVDGPACFTCSRPHEPLAKTRLFRLMLEHRCPGFVSVPFFEWEPLKSVQHRMSYLSEKLQPHFT